MTRPLLKFSALFVLLLAGGGVWRAVAPSSGKSASEPHLNSETATGESPSQQSRKPGHPELKDPELRRVYDRCLAGLRNDPPIDDAFMEDIAAWKGTPADYRQLILAVLDADEAPLPDRLNLVENLMFPMSSAYPLEALGMMDVLSARLGLEGKMHYLTVNLIGYAAAKDPQYAFDWLEEHAGCMDPDMLKRSSLVLLTYTSAHDPAAAFSFASQLSKDLRNEAVTSIGRGIEGAANRTTFWQHVQEMAASLPPEAAEELHSAALQGLTSSLGGEHFHPGGGYNSPVSGDEAIHWLEGADLSTADLAAVCRSLPAFSSPDDTRHVLDWVISQLPEGERQGNLTCFLSSWAIQQPAGVEQWLRDNADSPGFQENATLFLAVTGSEDPAAFDRIAALFPDDQRDAAMAAIHGQISQQQNDTRLLLENGQQNLQEAIRRQQEAYQKARDLRERQH